jgi:ubiquinone/menaquinone biosynthesis C-methylase UbiE
VAQDIICHYKLKPGDSVLEVGCAKGFLLHDLKELIPGLKIQGLDISSYAISKALPGEKPFLTVGDASALSYPDNSFDLVLCINTLSELPLDSCRQAIKEISRVSKRNAFITLNSWRNEKEKENLEKWNLTAQSNLSKEEWRSLLNDIGYHGDYHWFFAV